MGYGGLASEKRLRRMEHKLRIREDGFFFKDTSVSVAEANLWNLRVLLLFQGDKMLKFFLVLKLIWRIF
jgi:hypothetical protein